MPLPIRLDPGAGESLESLLDRTAAPMHTSIAHLLQAMGLVAEGGHTPPFFGSVADAQITVKLARGLGLSTDAVRQTMLERYSPNILDLDPLRVRPARGATAAVLRRQWIFVAGTRFCPRCLADTSQWKVEWRLPWITTCPQHRAVLISHCPGCGLPPRSSVTRASTRVSVVSAAVCRNMTLDGGDICGTRLDLVPLSASAPMATRTDAHLRCVIEGGQMELLGRPSRPFEVLQAWRAAACLVSAFSSDPRDMWHPKRPWLSPPRDAQTMRSLLQRATPLIEAPDAHTAAELLSDFVPRTTRPSSGWKALLREKAGKASPLTPVIDAFATMRGRPSSRLHHARQLALPVRDLPLGVIPQLAWTCALPPSLSTRPSLPIRRAVFSLSLARLAGSADWLAAAQDLQVAPAAGRRWTRYTFGAMTAAERTTWTTAVDRCATALSSQPPPTRTRSHWIVTARDLRLGDAAGCDVWGLGRCSRTFTGCAGLGMRLENR